MSLRVWLPLNGSLENKGLDDAVATLSGAVTVNDNGKIGKCYKFGTATGRITLPASTMTSFNECSVTFWVNILGWQTNWDTFFQAGLGNRAWTQYTFGILRNQGSHLVFCISNNSTASQGSYYTSDLTLETWYHLGFTYKAGHCCIYVNGELFKDYDTTIVPKFNGITHVSIGQLGNEASYQTNCKMNDFRIYDHALSPMEVKQISQGLILHYPLNHGGLGQENLIKNSNIEKISKNTITTYNLTDNGVDSVFGQTLTISAYIKSDTDNAKLDCYVRSSAASSMNSLVQFSGINTEYKKYTAIIVCNIAQSHTPKWFAFRTTAVNGNTSTATFSIKNVKLEEGTKPTPWCPAPSDDLYSIIGGDEDVEYDCSGYSNNGTKIGTIDYSSDTPRYNVSTVFNNSPIKINDFIFTTDIWTISFWYYLEEAPTGFQCFICLSRSNGADANKKIAACPNTSRIWFKFENVSLSVHSLKIQEWTHIAMTCDGVHGKVYENGILKGTTGTISSILTDCNDLVVGARSNATDITSTAVPFAGSMSDIRIYATALSPEDVLDLYNLGAAIDTNNNLYSTMLEEV